tara:strand:- start:1216 stop:1404 length:189 start_codon:yes stop_codon:yes gene_type:complete
MINHTRTRHEVSAVSWKEVSYGFSHTFIIKYEDGTDEEVRWIDGKTMREGVDITFGYLGGES